jgi:hypothetical protein
MSWERNKRWRGVRRAPIPLLVVLHDVDGCLAAFLFFARRPPQLRRLSTSNDSAYISEKSQYLSETAESEPRTSTQPYESTDPAAARRCACSPPLPVSTTSAPVSSPHASLATPYSLSFKCQGATAPLCCAVLCALPFPLTVGSGTCLRHAPSCAGAPTFLPSPL